VLLEAGTDALSVIDDLAGVVIQPSPEAREALELLELRVGELEIACDPAEGRALRLAADARDRFADIDCGQYA